MERPIQHGQERFAEISPRDGLDLTATSQQCKGMKSHGYALKDPDYFYQTSNKRDFTGYPGLPAPNARPKSSKFYPSEGKFLKSSYQDEYCGKEAIIDSASRSVTDSAHRRNKPHPLEAFMIWKFPGRLPPLENVHDLNKELMEQVSRESLKSTYQVDYIGLTQGTQQMQESLKNFYPTMKSDKPPYTLDSTKRFDYQQPQRHGSLKNNTSRYGCNARRQVPARGAVPNISSRAPAMQRYEKTMYSDEYIDKSESAKISEHVRPIVAKRLNKFLDSQKFEDKENRLRTPTSGRFSQSQ
ncbi:testis-expressed protein 26-like isoform X2 [Rhopilema esculentum]